ncbi:MAG: TIGR02530 family flagellar biosynthesis protein [Thermoleophilia bacterium]
MSTEPTRVAAVTPVGGAAPVAPVRRADSAAAAGFDRILGEKLRPSEPSGALRWSAHAVQRLTQREISITPETQARLEGAVDKLAAKGGRESVVLMDGMAFVVSVTNRTVITAVDQAGMRDQVFTNIDSAVVG